MNQPTATEITAYGAMQARLVALLLRYDEGRFGRMIGVRTRQASERDTTELQRYRDLGAVFVLRDELFEDILPRIVRRLSFASPRSLVIEEPPARGRVDWGRTRDAAWAERPGEIPLLLHTHQQRRTFATPENLLTVLTLLEYQAEVQRLLWDEQITAGSAALRHPLNEIHERCDRALAFPQFAGIRGTAQQILTGENDDADTREHQVRERLIPGSNSAYEDLLDWRARLRTVRLLRRSPADSDDVLGANPERDNYLYQIWIFYEIADLLRERGCLDHIDPRQGQMHLRFRWGEGDNACGYELRHDQGVPIPPARWGTEPLRRHAVPGVRPDFYLWRIDPPMARVEYGNTLFWREPGVVWDAKYYRERETSAAPSSPVKRMIADLTLLGERHGTLLFAFLAGEATTNRAQSYRLRPADRDQSIIPDLQVAVQPLCPDTDRHTIGATLTAVLDEAHAQMGTPRIPHCQGVFLDTLSVAERGTLLGRNGVCLTPDDLLVCPKPHIGPWRVDLVSRGDHCCRDGRLCHITGQPGASPPVRPPRTAKELLTELDRLFETGDLTTLDEETVNRVMNRIEAITRRFAEITGALKDLKRYEAKLGDIGLDRTLHLLRATERESLALAIYLRDQLDEVGANDYSASIIHVARVLERELQRRILAVPGVSGADFPHGKPTLGTLGGVHRRNPALWGTITAHLSHVWVNHVDPDDSTFAVSVEQMITEVEHLVRVRNEAAHTTPIPRDRFRTILRALCNGGPLRIGALNVLLTAWPAE